MSGNSREDQRDHRPVASVELDGVVRDVSLALTPEARPGDYVLIHTGYAISVLDEAEAQETLALFAELDEASRQVEAEDESRRVTGYRSSTRGRVVTYLREFRDPLTAQRLIDAIRERVRRYLACDRVLRWTHPRDHALWAARCARSAGALAFRSGLSRLCHGER